MRCHSSTARHTPFGGYRTTPTANDTDLGFTGHRENRAIGLTYMNARFYVGSIGRFASADTIIPDPANPQAFNRYSYVQNRPIIMWDPSGHNGCTFGYLDCDSDDGVDANGFPPTNSDEVNQELVEAGQDAGVAALVTFAAVPAAVCIGATGGYCAGAVSLLAKIQTAFLEAAAAFPTATAAAGGVVETAVECSMTGGGCTGWDYAAGAATAGVSHRLTHGNSVNSTKPQHGYEIYEIETDNVVKTGISGQPLNQNGTSPRANRQINDLNRNEGRTVYGARIVQTNMPDRRTALDWEIEHSQYLWDNGNTMDLHGRPRPWE